MHNTQLHTGLPAFLKVLFIAKEKVLEKIFYHVRKEKWLFIGMHKNAL